MSLVKIAAVTSIIVAPALAISQLVDPFQSNGPVDNDIGFTLLATMVGMLCVGALVVLAFSGRQPEPQPVRVRANKSYRQREVRRL